MRFKISPQVCMLFCTLSIFALIAFTAFGCSGRDQSMGLDPNQNIIGKPITAMTAMNDVTGSEHANIVVFDKNVRVIHEFDLTDMKVLRTLTVDNPDVVHSVFFDDSSGLICDFSEAHVTLFDRNSNRYVDPLALAGHPKSAAYDSVHGFLVVYDDANTVGLMKLDANGSPLQTWAGGPLLKDDVQLVAGDIISDDKLATLVLSLNTGSLAKVDLTQSIAQRKWAFTEIATSIGIVKWIGPVKGYADRVLALTDNAVSLVSIVDGSVIDQHALSSSERVVLESKSTDAHVVLQTRSGSTVVVYTDGIKIHTRSMNASNEVIVSSRLSLDEDSWTLVDARNQPSWTYNSYEHEYSVRSLRKFRLSDSKGSPKFDIPDQAQLDVSETYVFAMYPTSPYGYAERISVADHSRKIIRRFNVGYIHN